MLTKLWCHVTEVGLDQLSNDTIVFTFVMTPPYMDVQIPLDLAPQVVAMVKNQTVWETDPICLQFIDLVETCTKRPGKLSLYHGQALHILLGLYQRTAILVGVIIVLIAVMMICSIIAAYSEVMPTPRYWWIAAALMIPYLSFILAGIGKPKIK